MTTYKSPGVYVEEIPSAVQPIAGVGTSTAGFIGVFEGRCIFDEPVGNADNSQKTFSLSQTAKASTTWKVRVGNEEYKGKVGEKSDGILVSQKQIAFDDPPASNPITISYLWKDGADNKAVDGEEIGYADNKTNVFPKDKNLAHPPAKDSAWVVSIGGTQFDKGTVGTPSAKQVTVGAEKVTFGTFPESHAISVSYCAELQSDVFDVIYKEVSEELKAQNGGEQTFILQVPRVLVGSCKDSNGTQLTTSNDLPKKGQVSVTLAAPLQKGGTMRVTYTPSFETLKANEVKLCTNFGEFKKFFGDFSLCSPHNNLAHAIYGFFNNGGTRCYVAWEKALTDVANALEQFEAIDEIAIVAVPGVTDSGVWDAVITHCAQKTQDRFAIFDSSEAFDPNDPKVVPPGSDYAAFYAPWIQVADPATGSKIYVPPSGHIAGIYARVDTNRGVHKAPANEPVLGALGLKYPISKAQQDGLNPQGINCIRELNGNIKVWGARTIGGDARGEWKYINVRRLFLYLRESIDEGTQWVVFEPNTPPLWAKITRNITAFLTNVWRAGALFGNTPQEAFYVKCDAETNPPELREAGQVVTEIGVAVAKPAEFVIFHVSQWQPNK